MTNLDPRIGVLNSGKFYAFVNGYDQPEVVGTLEEVETALGLRAAPTKASQPKVGATYIVKVSFQYPAWDEKNGIDYEIQACSKSEAITRARTWARRDGHQTTGKGRITYRAVEA